MRLTWHALLLAAIVLTVSGGKSGGGSRTSSGSSRSSGNSRPSSHSTGHGSISSGRVTKPQSSHTHSTSHVLPLSTGARTPSRPTSRPQVYNRNTPRPVIHTKPTTRPQIYNRNTPRPIVHPKPGFNTFSEGPGSHHSSTTGRRNTTSGSGGYPHGSTSAGSGLNHGRRNTTSTGGSFHTPSTTGRHNSTSGGLHHGSSTSAGSGLNHGRHNTTSSGGSFHTPSTTGRHNSTSGSGGLHHGSSTSAGSGLNHGRYNTTSTGGSFHPSSTTGRHNSTSGSGGLHHGSSAGRHNTTSGGGGFHNSSSFGGFNHGGSGGKVNDKVQQTHVMNQHGSIGVNPHIPSAPPLPSGSNPHAPSAPPLPGSHPPGHQPPAPGWHPGVTNDAAQKQNINNLNNQYPGAPPPYPGAPGHYPNQPPPPYPGNPGYYPNQPPPSYPGAPGYYPNQPPPPYPGTNHPYPNQPGYYPGGSQHYPVQQGGPVYYPPPPPPPPGYSPYGVPYYKDKSGIKGSDVVAGLALWELMRSRNHHHQSYGIQQVHHHHHEDGRGNYDSTSYYQPTYHDTMRERYTTRTTPSKQTTGSGAYNILEMTHYITADDKGVISSSEGNMTCISVYNAKSVSGWHQRQVNDFKKLYPNSTFPLYRSENDTKSENFTIVPGRIVHREPISITCCGTNKGRVDLNLLTNGKHPDVNCVNHLGHIPIKKLTFVRTQAQTLPAVNTTEWHEIRLYDPNTTTPVPLAPFPDNLPSNSSIPTPLAPFPSSVPLAPFPTNGTTSTVSSIDLSQTFAPIGTKNGTGTIDMTQVFSSVGSNGTSDSTVGVTSNPSDLIIG